MPSISELPSKPGNRVLNVLARWTRMQIEDFQQDAGLLHKLETFLNENVRSAGFAGEANRIKRVLASQVREHFKTSVKLL